MATGQSNQTPDKGRSITNILLAAIAFVLIIGVVVIAMKSGPGAKPVPSAGLSSGTTRTADEQTAMGGEVNTPSKKLDTGRIQETYLVAKTYTSDVAFTLTVPATSKEWAVKTVSTFNWIGEMSIARKIEANNGSEVTLVLSFPKARNLTVVTKLEGVKFELPSIATFAIDSAAVFLSEGVLPSGWLDLSQVAAEQFVNNQMVRGWLSRLSSDRELKSRRYIDELEGVRVRIIYKNGEGIKALTPIDCTLTSEQVDFIYSFGVFSDPYILPKLDSKPGDEWKIDGKDMLTLLDPSLGAKLSGSVVATRGENLKRNTQEIAQISITAGAFKISSVTPKTNTNGSWAPRGILEFSFDQNIVSKATLNGRINVTSNSTDHWLFESKQEAEPVYEILYAGSVR